MVFKTSNNSYKPIKSHRLGNASRSVQKVKYGCKICEKDEFGLCWLYFQNFHPFSPLLAYKLLPNTCNLNSQQTAKHSSLHDKTNRAFLESEIVVEIYWPKYSFRKVANGLTDKIYPTREPPPPPFQFMQNVMHLSHIVFFSI